MRIIPRRIEFDNLKAPGWKMLYGRRKTGKTFLVRNFLDYEGYFFANRNGTVIDINSKRQLSYDEFRMEFIKRLGEGVTVIDEFHRLPREFLDTLHAYSPEGEVILITSTLWLAMRLLGERESPLLGIVVPVRIGLIDEREILAELSKEIEGKELVEASVYLREPVLVPLYRPSLREFLTDYFHSSGALVREIVGEAFSEEELRLSEVYLAVLHSIADGKSKSTEIGNYLLSGGLIEAPSSVQKYLKVLTAMGLVRKKPIHGKKKRFRYSIASPLLDLHFYLEAKYAYTELETPREFIRRAIDEKLPRHVEGFVESLLAKIYGLRPVSVEMPELELDIALEGFKKLELVGEVKWKNRVKREEVRRIEEKLGKFNCRKVLIVPSVEVLEREPEGIDVLTPEELLKLAKESLKGKPSSG
ncbi:ATPase [Thermococcus sp.]|uniref:ATPase n=2 Tax=Thermococcus sp. TaxID=35749 RepID=UPI00260CA87E|nr:ATPase [Thermococcus sp.]